MGNITVTGTEIEGVYILEPQVFQDERGYFVETMNQRDLERLGIVTRFVQENQSGSVKGVLRGLHFQKNHPQGKLLRVIMGSIYDVAVDLRRDSHTYGKWCGIELSRENRKQFYIPEGFAHGFLVLSDRAEICYNCTDYYEPSDEEGIAWNDPSLGIKWPGVTGVYQGSASSEGYYMEDGTPLILNRRDQEWKRLSIEP